MSLMPILVIDRDTQSLLFPLAHDGAATEVSRKLSLRHSTKLGRKLLVMHVENQRTDRTLN